ncbi:MAG: diaminopimelate decarboxylase [Endomicrobium sp.]|jgi:diaminopimelate decarboxylase|nr:diaminopimelate decarboxylase [Endomicrobium sp.]
MLNFKGRDLYIENTKVYDIAKKYGTGVYVYSKNKLMNNFRDYKEALNFSNADNIVCFACKSNSNKTILKLLADAGSGADTTSGGEIYKCLNASFDPSKIVYAGVGKTPEEIEYALKNKILMFNVESIEELNAIDKIAGKIKTKAKISFRINPHVNPDTHSYIVTGKKGTKFGIAYEDAVNVYLAAKNKKNIVISGIHFHIGSQIFDIKPFEIAAKKIKKIIDDLEDNDIHIEYINCGGGLGVKYNKTQKSLSPKYLISKLLSIFGKNKKIILEPGRSIVANAGYLVAKVIYRKFSDNKNFIITDVGMNDLIRPTLYNAYHEIIPVKKVNSEKIVTDIVGPICESGDFIGKDRILPILEQGEYILINCAGAYCSSMSSWYNSRLPLAEVLVDDNKAYIIKKRAKFKDLLLNEE